MTTTHCVTHENSDAPGARHALGQSLATGAATAAISPRPTVDLNLDLDISIVPGGVNPPTPAAVEKLPPLTGVMMVLSTEQIRLGAMPTRVDRALAGECIEPLRASLKEFGINLVPIIVRQLPPTRGMTQAQYELASGHRRLQVARDEGMKIKALVLGPSERSPDLLQLIANVLREPLSPFESGRQIRHVIDNEWTKSVSALAHAIGKSKTQVSRELALAGLPSEVLDAFLDLRELRVLDGPALKRALTRNPQAVLAEAGAIAALVDKPDARDTVKRLLAAAGIPGTVAPCNTPQNLLVRDHIVGTWCTGKAGELDILIKLPMSIIEQKRLIRELELVLKKFVEP